jgi:hypothetical protein
MMSLAQYRCYFLDSTGSIGSDETIECFGEQDAVAAARDMLEHRPHYHGVELWKGARRIHMEVRVPEVPAFVIRAAQRG